MNDNQIFKISEPISSSTFVSPPTHSRSKLIKILVTLVIVALLIVGYGVLAKTYRWWPRRENSISKEDTELYFFGSKEFGFQFSFRYPKDYCTSQDIGTVTVLYKTDCLKTYGQQIDYQMNITTFPDTNNHSTTTEEYIKSLISARENTIDTGQRRKVAGYTAHLLKDQNSNYYAWVFLTNYRWDPDLPDLPGGSAYKYYWGVIISTNLDNQPGGAQVQETVLNSFAIGDKAETPEPISKEELERRKQQAENSIFIRGQAMETTLNNGELWLIDKNAYATSAPSAGDIVSFKYPVDPTQTYVERIIGIPGDTIEIRDGNVYRNEIVLQENYLAPETKTRGDLQKQTVPPDKYFVLGDNRDHSSDSRFWGFVPREYILAKLASCLENCLTK